MSEANDNFMSDDIYNFLSPKLLPKVFTSSACTENYEVSNLISNDLLVKSRGFLTFSSIKPPVDIDFELICPISITHISLSTVVGTQKSTGIEILVKNVNTPYISICQAVHDKCGIVFCNSRFYSKKSKPKDINEDYYLAFFKSNHFRSFTNTKTIKVRIFRTEKSVPCLGNVEIWGKISKTCSRVTVKTIHSLVNKIHLPTGNVSSSEPELFEQFDIPEDFKDSLTFEVMAIPMTLPSGHTVDQSTLEKCITNDATYGRQGSDPFTGLKFTDSRKPVFNAPLKARIDMFLVENSHKPETYKLKRTLGKPTEIKTQPSTSITNSAAYDPSKESRTKKCKLDNNSDNSDLEQAISKVLNKSDFIRFTVTETKSDVIIKCSLCDCCEILYVLPCTHLYCRTCLVDLCKILICKVCLRKFSNCDPKRHHI